MSSRSDSCRIWWPDRGHEVLPGELGKHPSVETSGLAGERGALTFFASAISTDPRYRSKVSRTKRGPFIDSMAARTCSCLP